MKCAVSILCFCFHDLNRNRQLVLKSYITCAKVQSKHMLNTSEHWLNAIDFIGKFENKHFWIITQHTFNTTPNYIHKHANWDKWVKVLQKLLQFIPCFISKYIHKHVDYVLDVNEIVLEIVATHPQLCFLCNLLFLTIFLHQYQFNFSSTFLARISKNGNK